MSDSLTVQISDEDLLRRLTNTEDNFTERKRFSDDREWLRTVIGFANSCPLDFPGVLFIGAYNDGRVERPKKPGNLDSLQKTLTDRLNEAWPPIFYLQKVLKRESLEFLAVLVPGSHLRPHFGGKSYLRFGSETREASEKQFNELLAQRNSKAFAILQWKGRQITAEVRNTENYRLMGPVAGFFEPLVVSCDAFSVTLKTQSELQTVPLNRLLIGHDDERNRLKLEIYPMPI
jgi:predicted HTH transcriptional regulator